MPRSCRAAARSTASFASLVCLVVAIASCTGDQAPSAGDAAAGGGTVAVATLPRVTPTVVTAAASTAPPTVTAPPTTSASAAVTTTGPTTTGPTTTAAPSTARPATATSTAPAPPCQLALIVEQTQTAYEGITPSDLACAEDWAAWIGRPEDELADGFFAVARYVGGSWELMNLGTAGVCADSGVPAELWTELGCFE